MAQRQCESPKSCPSRARAFLTGIVSVCFLCMAGTVSVAQLAQFGQSSGDVRGPNVFVDMEVLNSLGPVQTVPRILQPTLRQPRMPGASAPETSYPNMRAPGSRSPNARSPNVRVPFMRSQGAETDRIVLIPPSSLKPRKLKRRASKKRTARLTAPKSRLAATPKKATPQMTRPGPRPPSAPDIQSVQKSPAARKPPRALVKRVPKAAVKSVAVKPVARAIKPVVPEAAPETRKPPMPGVLARPTPPTPRSSITPPPMPRKTSRATPSAPSTVRKITPPALDAAPVIPRQTASLPSSGGGKTGTANMVRLGFESGQAKLAAPAIKQLDDVVRKLTKETALRLQLLAYAGGATSSGSQARRLSLSRALAVRSYLIEKGIRSTRIDVRALGNQVKGSPADRVDVIINNR